MHNHLVCWLQVTEAGYAKAADSNWFFLGCSLPSTRGRLFACLLACLSVVACLAFLYTCSLVLPTKHTLSNQAQIEELEPLCMSAVSPFVHHSLQATQLQQRIDNLTHEKAALEQQLAETAALNTQQQQRIDGLQEQKVALQDQVTEQAGLASNLLGELGVKATALAAAHKELSSQAAILQQQVRCH